MYDINRKGDRELEGTIEVPRGFTDASVVKNPPANAGDMGSILRSGRSPGGGRTTPVFLPRKTHEQRNLAGYSPWHCKKNWTQLSD